VSDLHPHSHSVLARKKAIGTRIHVVVLCLRCRFNVRDVLVFTNFQPPHYSPPSFPDPPLRRDHPRYFLPHHVRCQVDFVFALDGSVSSGTSGWAAIKLFAQAVVENLAVGPTQTQVPPPTHTHTRARARSHARMAIPTPTKQLTLAVPFSRSVSVSRRSRL
jgi:hypothetical protein